MLETKINAPIKKLCDLLAPWNDYRLQWDDLLENISIIDKFRNDVYLIRHLVRKQMPLSPRESIDIVKVLKNPDGTVIFAATGTTHGSYPPLKNYVRTHQYIGAYILEVESEIVTKVTMIFHADLNLPGPKFLASFADRFKPKLMIDTIRNMKKAAKTIQC